MKLSVIIPAYNEAATMAEILDQVKAASLPDGMDKEIIVVNDGSTDGTQEIVEKYLSDPSIRLFNQKNQGKAAGVIRGFKEATGDIFIIQDADLEYHPNQYAKLVKPIADGQEEVVYGSRFMGQIKNMRPVIRLVNAMTNWTLNIFHGTKITDTNTCFKVFSRKSIEGMDFVTTHFGWDTEVTVKVIQRGFHIHEIPIDYVARTREEGKKIRFVTGFGSYLQIIRFSLFKK